MKSYKQLVEEGLINEGSVISRNYVALFYSNQLDKFNRLGMGKETENGVVITPTLIKTTERRLNKLKPIRMKTQAKEKK